MIHFSAAQILNMEQRYRTTFVNSLSGYKSINLVGTQNNEGLTNVAIFNSIMHIGAHPPLMGVLFRPDSVERHTFENITDTKYFTINHVHEKFYRAAHQTSARYPRKESEFDACGLTPLYQADFFAPFVKESHLQIALSLVESVRIAVNNTILVVGALEHVFIDQNALNESGSIDLEVLGSVAGSGLDAYYSGKKLSRLRYAKPYEPLMDW